MAQRNKISYDDWTKSLEGLSDEEISYKIKDIIMSKDDIPFEMKRLYSDIFDYSVEKIKNKKTFDIDLLKIYLKDIKGYTNIQDVNIYQVLLMLSASGINWVVSEN